MYSFKEIDTLLAKYVFFHLGLYYEHIDFSVTNRDFFSSH